MEKVDIKWGNISFNIFLGLELKSSGSFIFRRQPDTV